MKFPKSVRIGPHDFTIKPLPARKVDGTYGDFNQVRRRIRIQRGLAPSMNVDIMLHELSHAIWWVWNIKSGDKDERIINTMATALTALFRDNPKLLKAIVKALK